MLRDRLASICYVVCVCVCCVFCLQAEDGIRDLVRSRGLGDVYKRQQQTPRDDLDLAVPADHTQPDGQGRGRSLTQGSDLSLIHI